LLLWFATLPELPQAEFIRQDEPPMRLRLCQNRHLENELRARSLLPAVSGTSGCEGRGEESKAGKTVLAPG